MRWPRAAIRRDLARAAFVAVLGVVLYAGLRQHSVPEMFDQEDKLYHLLGFAALAAGTRLAFPRGAWWWQVLGVLAVGAGVELVQVVEPDRLGSIWDFAFDAMGVGVGWLLWRVPMVRRWAEA